MSASYKIPSEILLDASGKVALSDEMLSALEAECQLVRKRPAGPM